jgi:hypothetical protein
MYSAVPEWAVPKGVKMVEQEIQTLPEPSEAADPVEQLEATPEEAQTIDGEKDWKVEAEQLRGRAEKAENDLKAQRNQRQSLTQQMQQVVTPIMERLEASEKSNERILRALASGDTDQVSQELEEIGQERVKTTELDQRFQGQYDGFYRELMQIQEDISDDQGNPVFDVQTSPEMTEVRNEWNEAYSNRDVGQLAILLSRAQRIAFQIQRKNTTEQGKRADDNRKENNARNNTLGVGAQTGTSSASMSDDARWAAFGRGELPWNDEVKRAGKRLGYSV